MGQGLEGGVGRGESMLLSGGTASSCNGGALRDSRGAGPMCVVGSPCCVAACVCVGVAAESALLRFLAFGSASSKRFLFLIMSRRRECAKSVSASNIDLNRR